MTVALKSWIHYLKLFTCTQAPVLKSYLPSPSLIEGGTLDQSFERGTSLTIYETLAFPWTKHSVPHPAFFPADGMEAVPLLLFYSFVCTSGDLSWIMAEDFLVWSKILYWYLGWFECQHVRVKAGIKDSGYYSYSWLTCTGRAHSHWKGSHFWKER